MPAGLAATPMLVISRKVGESVVIGDDVTVTVVKLAGGGVRLGIDAPRGYLIVREELQDGLAEKARERGLGRETTQPHEQS